MSDDRINKIAEDVSYIKGMFSEYMKSQSALTSNIVAMQNKQQEQINDHDKDINQFRGGLRLASWFAGGGMGLSLFQLLKGLL